MKQWIPHAIGKPTNATKIRGRENVPVGDKFDWWSCKYVYIDRITKKEYYLEDLCNKYKMGFGQSELWDIIEKGYDCESDYIMNINHPRYDKLVGKSRDIVFEEDK